MMMSQNLQAQRRPGQTPPDPSSGRAYTPITTDLPKTSSNTPTKPAHKPSIVPRGFNPRSCHICRRRKVKCDKLEGGCGNCAKAHVECVYPGPGRAPRRSKNGTAKGTSERETELLKRLRRLEGVVEELSGQVEIENAKATSEGTKSQKNGEVEGDNASQSCATPVRVVGMDEGSASTGTWAVRMIDIGGGPPKSDMLENEFGKLLIDEGKSRYVSSSFWARFYGEKALEGYDEPESEEEEGTASSPEDSVSASVAVDISNHHSFVMGFSSAEVDLRSLHPLPSQIPFYWETFKENVDPLCKVMHIPTMSKTMKEVKDNLGTLSRSTDRKYRSCKDFQMTTFQNCSPEALCFAIYFATIVSMSEEEVQSNFGLEKTFLLSRYRFGTEQALARAGFLHTSEIVTVQAFVLFLVCVRRFDDSKFVWTLTGLVVRIAQSLGLHRDGTNFDLSPFDTEMRRRCWWQICLLDTRASEDYGSDPAITDYSFDTKFPLNINDNDLDPQSTEPPAPREGVSEMTFSLIRYELCYTTRQLSYVPPGDGPCKRAANSRTLAEKEELVKELHERLESKYLVYCHDSSPLFWVSATVARLIVAKMGLVIYSPHLSEGLPQSIKDRLFIASIEIMEYSQLLQSEVSTKKWGWLFHTYVQWHAIAFILGEVCARSYCDVVERGWRAVDGVFGGWNDAVKHSKNGMLWGPMRRLMAKARRKREADIQTLRSPLSRNLPMSDPSISSPASTEDILAPATFGAVPLSRPNLFDENLDPIRPLQPGLPIGGQWDGLSGMSELNAVNLAGLVNQRQVQSQLEAQFQQFSQAPNRPWILDDSALLDLDMKGLDSDSTVDGWSEMANYFQMELDSSAAADGSGGVFNGGMQSWL